MTTNATLPKRGRGRPAGTDTWASIERYIDRHGPDECWPWEGPVNTRYGTPVVGRGRISVKRVIYERCAGHEIPHKPVRNTCGETQCCNPAHMYQTDGFGIMRGDKANMASSVASEYKPI